MDIENRDDIKILINNFYSKVKMDDLLGPIFEQANVNWEAHLPVMYDFWEGILFNKPTYKGNPIVVHQQLHMRIPLSKENFERWLENFNSTVDASFTGENAERIKQKAAGIATVMQLKIFHNKQNLL